MSWIEDPGLETFKNFNISDLSIDEAWAQVTLDNNPAKTPLLWLYELSADCHSCPFQRKLNSTQLETPFKVSSTYPFSYRFRVSGDEQFVHNDHNDKFNFCQLSNVQFGEFGVYSLRVTSKNVCDMEVLLTPVNVYYPILIAFLACLGFLLLSYAFKWLRSSLHPHYVKWYEGFRYGTVTDELATSHASSNDHDDDSIANSTSINPTRGSRRDDTDDNKRRHRQGSSQSLLLETTDAVLNDDVVESVPACISSSRLKSLDTFRGICIILMIFVNDGGGGYYFMEHATWDGLHVADFVFPWFVWIMGVCIPLSINAGLRRNSPRSKLFFHILKRSVTLILLGLVVNSSRGPKPVPLEHLRFPGVLQRFGVSYFVCATVYLVFGKDRTNCTNQSDANEPTQNSLLQDIRLTWIGWLFALIFLGVHSMITFLLPVPGCPTGYLGPAGLHANNSFPGNCIGGAAGHIDRILFGNHHIYRNPTAKSVYHSGVFDPEGTLGVLTTVFQAWLGVQAGVTLHVFKTHRGRLIRWIIWSVLLGSIGTILCTMDWIPINKNLWSLTYVLVTSSLALAFLSFIYVIVDTRGFWSGSPFSEAGMNSIGLYMGSTLTRSSFPWHFSISTMRTHFLRLSECLWGTLLWICIGKYLFAKKLILNL